MTDGQRDWEIQLPEIATAYEVKVPLSGKRDGHAHRPGVDDRRRPRDHGGARGVGAGEQLADGDARTAATATRARSRARAASAATDDDDDDDGKSAKAAKADRRTG